MEKSSASCDLESQLTGCPDLTSDPDIHETLPPYENTSKPRHLVSSQYPESSACHENSQAIHCSRRRDGFSARLDPISRAILLISVTLICLHALYTIPRAARLADDAFPAVWQRKAFSSILLGYYGLLVCAPVMLWRARTYGDALCAIWGPSFLGLMGMCMLAGAGWRLFVGDGWRQD
ncbi:hypothetical protein BJ742DRAFT_800969 [Cladochytrium replicatum]|nr:hypothetical protein BJ742DRAFT_800969 [Cladochytrium replicatum]